MANCIVAGVCPYLPRCVVETLFASSILCCSRHPLSASQSPLPHQQSKRYASQHARPNIAAVPSTLPAAISALGPVSKPPSFSLLLVGDVCGARLAPELVGLVDVAEIDSANARRRRCGQRQMAPHVLSNCCIWKHALNPVRILHEASRLIAFLENNV
jgi:hypothetical protein